MKQMKPLITCALAGLLCSNVARAQVVELPFPLDPSAAPEGIDALALKAVPERIAALTDLSSVVLRNVPLPGAGPGGTFVDLELERLHTERLGFGFHVDGNPRLDLLEGLALSIWKGSVVGQPSSEVMLSFSTHGTRGWIRTDAGLVHVMPRPDANGDWTRGDVLLATDESMVRAGARFEFACEAKRAGVDSRHESARAPRTSPANASITGGSAALGSNCNLRECKVAIEGDYQLFQVFGNLGAETTYVTTLLTYVSDRYETQASTVLTFPYLNLWSTSNDGWDAQDTGGNCQAVLTELQATWVGNVPAGANLGHLMSGANLGCGVAWLDVLCDPDFNFSVSGNLNGNVSFPIAVSPTNWDFMVVAHEIGHNFDALHTHDYCPPLDQCPPSQYFGACQTQQVCTNQGTIMSYCHLCSGGTNNITTFFHTTSAADMTAASLACLPAFVSLDGTSPTLVAPNAATPVSAQVVGSPVGPVQVYYRPNGSSSFTPTAMTPQGGGLFAGSLPAAACGDSPQFYYAFTDANCGGVTDPAGAPGTFYTALVGTPNVTFSDNFQSNLGWSPSNLGATSGDWQRGVPVNDAGWAYDPASDYDGSGSCWLTQNAAGNTDVDGGAVQLLSPAFSLTGGPALITYAYFLRLTDSNGADRLLVEASSNGTSGPWIEVARHDTDGGLTWHTHAIDAGDLAAAGVVQTANMRLRYTANDANPGSIVEAGLDAFAASVLTCGQIGTNYCTPADNSTGRPALMSATGSASVAANNLVLKTQPVPAGSGVVFYGDSQTYVALGNGFRCVAGTLLRGPVAPAVGGVLTFPVNNTIPPAAGNIIAGSTWNFEAWYRDVPAGGALFNLSDGYTITFGP